MSNSHGFKGVASPRETRAHKLPPNNAANVLSGPDDRMEILNQMRGYNNQLYHTVTRAELSTYGKISKIVIHQNANDSIVVEVVD